MNMMTVIPTVMEIEIAKTEPPAIISVIFFSPACVLRPTFSVQFELSHDGRREHITRCSVFLLPREACRHVPRLGGIDHHVQTKRPLGCLRVVRLDHAVVASCRDQNTVQDTAGRVQAFDVAEFCLLD
jgi:hypothetical protein